MKLIKFLLHIFIHFYVFSLCDFAASNADTHISYIHSEEVSSPQVDNKFDDSQNLDDLQASSYEFKSYLVDNPLSQLMIKLWKLNQQKNEKKKEQKSRSQQISHQFQQPNYANQNVQKRVYQGPLQMRPSVQDNIDRTIFDLFQNQRKRKRRPPPQQNNQQFNVNQLSDSQKEQLIQMLQQSNQQQQQQQQLQQQLLQQQQMQQQLLQQQQQLNQNSLNNNNQNTQIKEKAQVGRLERQGLVTCVDKYNQLLEDIFMGHEIIPDVLDGAPKYLLELSFRTVRIYPGMRVTAQVTDSSPILDWPSEPDAQYVIVMSNLDINSRANRSLAEFWHWFIVNVPGGPGGVGSGETRFQLMHPLVLADGTGDHRFGLFVMKQPQPNMDFSAEGGPIAACGPAMTTDRGPKRSIRALMRKYRLELIAATFFTVDHDKSSDEIACAWQKCMQGSIFANRRLRCEDNSNFALRRFDILSGDSPLIDQEELDILSGVKSQDGLITTQKSPEILTPPDSILTTTQRSIRPTTTLGRLKLQHQPTLMSPPPSKNIRFEDRREYLEPNYGGPTPAQKINFEEQFEHVDYDYSDYRDLGNDNYFSKQMQKWSDGFWT